MDSWFASRGTVPVVAAVVGMMMGTLYGCNKDSDDTGDESPTPTKQELMADDFRVIRAEIGSSSEGVDIDGDGKVDNGIEDAMDSIVTSTMDAVETGIYQVIDSLPGTITVPDSAIKMALGMVEEALAGVLNVESLSRALSAPIENFTINYALEFQEQVDGSLDLNWYRADMTQSGGLEVDTSFADASLGIQTGGFAEGTWNGHFDGDLTLVFIFDIPDAPSGPGASAVSPEKEEVVMEITLREGATDVVDYNASKLRNAYTGGVILVDDMLSLIQTILEGLNNVMPAGIEIPIDDILPTIETSMEKYADMTVGGSKGYSIGLVLDADAALVNML